MRVEHIGVAAPLHGLSKAKAMTLIATNHYLASVPSGKSYYFQFDEAIVVFSISANMNLTKFLLGSDDYVVWDLARLWAPDGHEPNLLTMALSAACKWLRAVEPRTDAVVAYADPAAGHHGGVYRAASWHDLGQTSEDRRYRDSNGRIVARRAFHSGKHFPLHDEIIAVGYTLVKQPKHRYARPLSRKAKAIFKRRWGK